MDTFQVINPGFVIGPFLYPAPTSTSGVVIRRLMQRDYPRVPLLSFGCVDVRDVARAHIEAMKVPEAGGKR